MLQYIYDFVAENLRWAQYKTSKVLQINMTRKPELYIASLSQLVAVDYFSTGYFVGFWGNTAGVSLGHQLLDWDFFDYFLAHSFWLL